MSDIFLSYRRSDQPLARALVEALQSRGVNVWWDQKIEGGEDWRDAIVEGLTGANVLVILFSNECNASKQLKKELAIADTLDKEVVPVLIEDTKPKGHYLYELAARNWLQIFPEPLSKIDTLADRLAREILDDRIPDAGSVAAPDPARSASGAGLSVDAPTDQAVAPPHLAEPDGAPGEAPPLAAGTVERVVEKARRADKADKGLRDFMPFKWYELVLIAGLTVLFGAVAETAEMQVFDGLFMGVFSALAIATLVFPFRYYLRRRRVRHALLYYMMSTGLLALALGLMSGIHPEFAQGGAMESLLINIVVALIIWLIFALIAFGIYGILHFQRTLRSFRDNVEAV